MSLIKKPSTIDTFIYDSKLLEFIKTIIQNNNVKLLVSNNSSSGKTTLLELIKKYYFKDECETVKHENCVLLNQLNEQNINFFRKDLKLFCQIKSTCKHKKKLILIDDFDLISEQNQKILRNFIDNYCHNVNFICTCSNLNKIITSVQSRLLLVNLQNYFEDFFKEQILHIKDGKEIFKNKTLKHLSNETLIMLKKYSNNNFKIFKNNLQKLYFISPIYKIKDFDVQSLNYFSNHNIIETIFKNIKCRDYYKCMELADTLVDNGLSNNDIYELVIYYCKEYDILTKKEKSKIIKLTCDFIKMMTEDYSSVLLFFHKLYTNI